MKKKFKDTAPARAIARVGEWVALRVGFWWNAILSLPEWAAEEREIRAEEEEMRARMGKA